MFFIASSCGGSASHTTGVACAAYFRRIKLDCNFNRKITMKGKVCGSYLPATGTYGKISWYSCSPWAGSGGDLELHLT